MSESKKILIVDDNEDIIITYKVVLERMGYSVLSASDGHACIGLIEDEQPDLVLLDVRLPGISGTEVCRLIKHTARTKEIPVVAITASTSKDTRDKMAEVGADDFLLKPIDVSGLNRVVKKFLA